MVKRAFWFLKKHSTKILTVIEIGGTVYAVYRAFKDGPRFMRVLDELEERDATFVEKVKELAPVAAPAVLAGTASIAAALVKEKTTSAKIAELVGQVEAITSAYGISQNMNARIQQKTREVIGDEVADSIERSVLGDKIRNDISTSSVQVVQTGKGNDLFYDDWSGRYFYSDINYVKKVINDINAQLINEIQVSVNEFYAALGLPTNGSGEYMGWCIDTGQVDVRFTSGFDELDRVYTALRFAREPAPLRSYGRW